MSADSVKGGTVDKRERKKERRRAYGTEIGRAHV